MNATTVGIDLAKQVFQVHGADSHGKAVFTKYLSRKKLLAFLANLPPCLIEMEACASAHYWARQIQSLGHEVRLMSPQFVKPYIKGNKNDGNDAEGICEAVGRKHMRFVPIKSVEQHDIQSLHRIREQLIQSRTALVNQLRGLLGEYGIVIPQGIERVRRALPEILEDADNGLTALGRQLFAELYERLRVLDEQVKVADRHVEHLCAQDERCQRLVQIEGIGPLGATALVGTLGDAQEFTDSRALAAWLGLVPCHQASGGQCVLLGISKRGNRYLRTLLIHGARAVVRVVGGKNDARSRWIQQVTARRGRHVATVALAHKNARIAWALLNRGESYRQAA